LGRKGNSEGVGELGVGEGGRGRPWGTYIGSVWEGKRLPAGMAINGHAALMEFKTEKGLRRGNGRIKAGE
jgi:hypothetical protein